MLATFSASMQALATRYIPVPPPSPKTRPKAATAYQQIVAIQRRLYNDAMNEKVTASARAQVARAFDVLEERKRILKMRPKPKDVEVSVLPKKSRKSASAFAEPVAVVSQKESPCSPATTEETGKIVLDATCPKTP